jgi:hypothetical protein
VRHRSAAVAVAAVGLAGLSTLLAGCGGGSGSPAVAQAGSTSSTGAAGSSSSSQNRLSQAVRYAACMRSHGVTRFPDPTSQGGGLKLVIGPGSGVDPHSATFEAAQTACGGLLPAPDSGAPRAPLTREQLAGALSFSRCMRRHDVADFPDPTSQGLTLEMVQAAGVDVRAPAVVSAARTCLPAAHGAISGAQIERAEAEAAHARTP